MTFDAIIPGIGKDVEGLAARGTLRIYLDQTATPESRKGVVGWVEEHVGEHEKEVDGMSATDFLSSAGKFLEEMGIKSVYDVWFDRDVIYRVPKEREQEDNHKEALAKAASYSENGHFKEIGIWSHGMSGDFYLEFRLRFKRVHDKGSPSLILEVAGNPRELTDPTGENQFELDDRLKRLESSKADIEKENAQISRRFETKLKELQGIIKQFFRVRNIDQNLKVDVGSIW